MTKANGREKNGVTTLCRKRDEIVSKIGEKDRACKKFSSLKMGLDGQSQTCELMQD